MQTAAVIQHVPFEHLGTFEPLLRARGHEIRYVDATVDDLADPLLADADLLVVLGGPIGAFDEAAYPLIARELALVRQRLEAQRPLLG
ncbi:MAG TPA: glutamine amidotransferase, partial [Oleiagrimonas sp.]|nr:glutamine amidotransferase [Oleiagrimonas sp.]